MSNNISLDINLYNKLYYSSLSGAFTDYGLADFFTEVDLIQELIASIITSETNKKKIKVKEIGSGTSLHRWLTIAGFMPDIEWDITLTDFSKQALPNFINMQTLENLKITTSVYNLLQPFSTMKQSRQLNNGYDCLLTTYGFDSVWLPEDVQYKKQGEKWSKAIYSLFHAGENGNMEKNIDPRELEQISINKAYLSVDISAEPYGNIIRDYYKEVNFAVFNFPGGLINRVQQAIKNQLNRGGIFISGDIACVDKSQESYSLMEDIKTSGKFAKFKVEDYGLAKVILEKLGYEVELMTVADAMEKYHKEVPINLTDHCFLVVSSR